MNNNNDNTLTNRYNNNNNNNNKQQSTQFNSSEVNHIEMHFPYFPTFIVSKSSHHIVIFSRFISFLLCLLFEFPLRSLSVNNKIQFRLIIN